MYVTGKKLFLSHLESAAYKSRKLGVHVSNSFLQRHSLFFTAVTWLYVYANTFSKWSVFPQRKTMCFSSAERTSYAQSLVVYIGSAQTVIFRFKKYRNWTPKPERFQNTVHFWQRFRINTFTSSNKLIVIYCIRRGRR